MFTFNQIGSAFILHASNIFIYINLPIRFRNESKIRGKSRVKIGLLYKYEARY